MMNKCLDEGTLQGYLDGELSPEKMIWAAAHLAECPRCDGAAREAEADLNLFARAFAADNAAKVPTERLRQRIDSALFAPRTIPQESLAEIGEGRVRAWLSSLRASLAGPFAASRAWSPRWAGAMAGLAAVVLLGAVFAVVRLRVGEPGNNTGGETVAVQPTPDSVRQPLPAALAAAPASTDVANNRAAEERTGLTVANISYTAARKSKQLRAARASTPVAEKRNTLLPGEDNYLKTINSLAKTIEANGDAALRPTARAEYERNLAVIDEAISESRRVARRTPQDRDAAAFLFSAYRNKVDLMSAVADQTQLAAFGR